MNVDVSAELDGYFADTGGTIVVPPVASVKARLCHATQLALKHALAQARADAPINRIGKAIQHTSKSHGFKVIKNLAANARPGVTVTVHRTTGRARCQVADSVAVYAAFCGRPAWPIN